MKGVREFLNAINISDINEDIKQLVVQIRKKKKLKLPDSIIAATAMYLDVVLFTADQSFSKVEGLNALIY